MTPSSPLPIDWSQTNLRELVDFIGLRLGSKSADKGFISLLVGHALILRQWPGVSVFFKHPSGGRDIPYSMLEQDGECLNVLGATLEQIIESRYEKQPPKEDWIAFYPSEKDNAGYCRSVAHANPHDFQCINRALDAFSVEVVARRLSEGTHPSLPRVSSRSPRL